MSGKRRSALWFGLASLLVMVILALFYGPTDNWLWDPSYYYAQLTSPIIERDLDLRNRTLTGDIPTLTTPRGLQGSPFPVGPGIFWSPAFLAVHLPASLFFPEKATGYTFPYIAAVSFASLLFGAAGLTVLYRALRLFASQRLAAFSVLLTLAATPVAYFMLRQPIMAHTTNLFAGALILLAYLLLTRGRLPFRYSGITLGVFLGFCLLTRWSGAFMGVFPLAYFGEQAWQLYRKQGAGSWRGLLIQLGIFGLALGLTVSPQSVLWYGIYGSFLRFPEPAHSFAGSWLPSHLLDFFFSSNRGLLLWTPFAFLGLLGLLWAPERRLKWVLIPIPVMQILLISYWKDWVSGGLFGQRFLIELLPVIALGFVFLANRLRQSFPGRGLVWAGVMGGVLLVAHQMVLVYAVEHAIEPGWLDLERYTQAQPVGLAFLPQAFGRLLSDPGLWLAPRPFVAAARQAVLVNLLGGAASLRTLAIPLAGVVLAPVIVLLVVGLRRSLGGERALPVIAGLGLGLMLVWSAYLLALV